MKFKVFVRVRMGDIIISSSSLEPQQDDLLIFWLFLEGQEKALEVVG